MKVSEAMTPDVTIASPNQTIAEAARMMAECDAGVLPVSEGDRLVGMITDRDIAIRAVAQNRSPDTRVGDVMSQEVLYCFEDEDVEQVAKNMGENQVRRLPVLNRQKRLVGIVSFGDISHGAKPATIGRTAAQITAPSTRHNQAQAPH